MEVQDIIQRFETIQSLRIDFEEPWRKCREFALPYSCPIDDDTTNTQGVKSINNFDSSAELALRNLASVLLYNTTSPVSKWVQFSMDDENQQEIADAVENIVSELLRDSNAYSELFQFYKQLAGFGTATCFIEQGRGKKALNFKTMAVSHIYLAEDYCGEIDTVFRKSRITVRELVQKFGLEAMHETIKKKYESKPYDEVTILHAVLPRDDTDIIYGDDGKPLQDPKNAPWADFWIDYDNRHLMQEGGFRTFPYLVVRWEKEAGQVYGHGPVMDALADIKQLNRMSRSMIELAEKLTNPPKLFIGEKPDDYDLTPGAANVVDEDTKAEDLVSGANYPITDAAVNGKKASVQEALFVNQFQGLDRRNEKEMTAVEVHAIEMEALRILGPTSYRLQQGIERMLVRVLDILEQDGRLPKGATAFNINFINAITRAQQNDEVKTLDYLNYKVAELKQIYGDSIVDNFSGDSIIKHIFKMTGLPNDFTNKKNVVEQIRASRAEAQAKQEQLMMANMQSEMQKNSAQAQEKMSRVRKNDSESYSQGA